MAWVKKSYMNGQHSYWENDKTGEISYQEQSTAPDATGWQEKTYMDGQNKYWENADTGEIVYSKDATLTQEQLQQQFLDVFQNPNSSPWDKAQAVEKHYGIETLAQLSNQGYFGDYAAELNPYIAARQREANDAGFTIGGNKLGLWPVTLGMAAGGLYSSLAGGTTSAAAAPTATGVGSSTATQVGMVEAADAVAGGLGSVPGSSSAFDQLAQGGNTTTDVPLVGNSGGGLANYEAAVNAEFGTPIASTGGSSIPNSVLGGAGTAAGGAVVDGVMTDGATGGGSAAAGAGAGTALSRILAGTATDADWLSILGTAGATGLGMFGAGQQASALRDIANQARGDRAPFLAKSTEYLNNPNAYLEGPGKASMDAVLRSLSVKGNPAGMPSSMGLAGEYGLKSWLDATTGLGNLGLAGEDSRSNTLAKAAGADSNVLNALGYGIGTVTNPPVTLESLLRQMRGTGSASLV
jgi:hypothetical protein